MSELFSLDGKVAAVTGTNRGIGRVLARALASAGADIVHLNRTRSAEAEADSTATGRRAVTIPCELTGSQGSLAAAVEDAHAWQGRLDILVNSAGIVVRKPLLEQSAADLDEVLQIDLKAPFHLGAAAARLMAADGGGKIINIASLMSFQGGLSVASYAAAKSGLAGLTRAMSNEWASRGICVNAIVPGYIATDINVALQNDPVRAPEFKARIPIGRWGRPEDLAGGVIFLAAPASEYVTGHLLVIDGGWMSR